MSYPHLARLVHEQAKKYGARTALRYRDYDTSSWIPVTWNQFSNTVEVASRALLELGVAVHENVGIFSQNKPECFYTDFALYAVRAVSVPLYATSSCEQVEYIMRDAGIRYLFVSEQYQYDVACRVAASCPSLCRIIIFDRKVIRHSHDESSLYYNEFLSLGSGHATASELERRTADACDADLANILYTSGTTGESKGVMLHHSCYAEAFRIVKQKDGGTEKVFDGDVYCFFQIVDLSDAYFRRTFQPEPVVYADDTASVAGHFSEPAAVIWGVAFSAHESSSEHEYYRRHAETVLFACSGSRVVHVKEKLAGVPLGKFVSGVRGQR